MAAKIISVSEPKDRGRDVSDELTEVRTVLSRAESGLDRINWCENRRGEEQIVRWDFPEGVSGGVPVYEPYEPDQDNADMALALQDVVKILERWRKHGTTASQRRRRWISGESA